MSQIEEDKPNQETIVIPNNLEVSLRASHPSSLISRLNSNLRRLLGRHNNRKVPYPEKYGSNLYDAVYGLVAEKEGGVTVSEEFMPIYRRVREIVAEFPDTDAAGRANLVDELEELESSLRSFIPNESEVGDIYKKPGFREAEYVVKRAKMFPPIKLEVYRSMVRKRSLGLRDQGSSDLIKSSVDVYLQFKKEIESGKYSYDELFTDRREFEEMDRYLRELFSRKYEEARAKELTENELPGLLPPKFPE